MKKTTKSVERIPTYALPYLVNGDKTSLTDAEVKMIDDVCRNNCIELVTPIGKSVEGDPQPYFCSAPMFGKPTEVEDCIVIIAQMK